MICKARQADPRREPRLAAVPDSIAESAYPPLGRLVEIDGARVHACDHGDAGSPAPPVVLIHGANVNLRDWTFSLTGRLAEKRRVIAMDRPGFGYSDREAGLWTPARQAERLRRAARAMGAEKPIVVGHSWGAAVALAWALDAPESVSGVVSVSGATMPWGVAGDMLAALGVLRMGASAYTENLARRAGSGAIEAFVARAFTPQRPPRGYIDYIGAPLSLRARTLLANQADLARTHVYLSAQARRYGALTVPVEIVHGGDDWLLGVRRHVAGLTALLPDAHAVVAEGVGHMAHHARPDLLEAAIERLSARAAAAQGGDRIHVGARTTA